MQGGVDLEKFVGLDEDPTRTDVEGLVVTDRLSGGPVAYGKTDPHARCDANRHLQEIVGGLQKVLAIDRFEDDGIAAGGLAALDVVFTHPGCHHHNRDVAELVMLLDLDTAFVAVHLRHVQIHEDQVGAVTQGLAVGFLAVLGNDQVDVTSMEKGLLQLAKQFDVIDQEDFAAVFHSVLPPGKQRFFPFDCGYLVSWQPDPTYMERP